MLGVKGGWVLAAVLCGIFGRLNAGESSDLNIICRQQNILFVTAKTVESATFPPEAIYSGEGTKLCFSVNNDGGSGCCEGDFNCRVRITPDTEVILSKKSLCKHDVVLMDSPDQDYEDKACMPSDIYSRSSGFLYSIHKCLDTGNQNVRLSEDSLRGETYKDETACKDLAETDYKFKINDHNKKTSLLLCTTHDNTINCSKPSPEVSTTTPQPDSSSCTGISVNISLPALDGEISPEKAADIMKNISSLLEQIDECSTVNIVMGDFKGTISKLPSENQTSINFNLTTSSDVNSGSVAGFSRLVTIPTEAVAMALKKNGSFVAVLLFPGVQQDDPNVVFLNNEVIAIEMGTEITNLSQTIDIHYGNVNKNGNIASCRSWDGKGRKATWITDGCETEETEDNITCRCSHLTFFAILMSPPPGNMSSSDLQALTYITSIGCGLSMFFLAVGLFMHFLIRKGKASQATQILMNLFVAMLTLNLSFLVNESVAELGVFGACVAAAAVMHYAMLATITWFFMQALHLFLLMWSLHTDVKHYMMKICAAGWVTPAIVVVILAALSQYDYLAINVDGGKPTNMCFISDAAVHQGVNVGYYAVVFVFTLTVFIITLRQSFLLKPTAGKANNNSSIKTNSYSIFCLFLLLGITWAFAFFSHGPLLVPSYYIFTILNSLQGFFLFIYYYNSRKAEAEDHTVSGSSTATLNSASSPQK